MVIRQCDRQMTRGLTCAGKGLRQSPTHEGGGVVEKGSHRDDCVRAHRWGQF